MEQRVFISHAGIDRPWAEWVAWQLTDAGCTAFLDVRDITVGEDWQTRIERELAAADAVVVLLSASWATSHWAAAEARAGAPLVLVRLDGTPVPAEFAEIQAVDFLEADGTEARNRLVQAVLAVRSAQSGSPAGHLTGERRLRRLGLAGPRPPGSLPRVWNLPPRNPGFVGRDAPLARLREELTDHAEVLVTGAGGSGKTQLALEYAYRFAGEYELAWWIRSNRSIEKQLAELAVRIGAAPAGTSLSEAGEALKAELRERSRWLLVFDDIAAPAKLAPHLPDGVGHVLITARTPQRNGRITEFGMGPFDRTESVTLLRSALPSLTAADADAVAAALDDLPLALAQALGVLRDGMPVQRFLRMLTADGGEDGGPQGPFSSSLVATVHMAVDRLRQAGPPGAARLLFGCALLAPAPLPVGTRPGPARKLPDPLYGALPEGEEWHELLDALSRYGLARVQDDTVRLHPLTQSTLNDLLPDSERKVAARTAEALLISALPNDDEPGTDQRWTDLLPHLLAVDPTVPVTAEGRHALRTACGLLMERGDTVTARDRLELLVRSWSSTLGGTHPDTLLAAALLAEALRLAGDTEASRHLVADVLYRRQRTLGHDHPDTLVTAARLAAQLGEDGDPLRASVLAGETLGRMRRVLGEDHPFTLTLAANLAVDLRDLGDTDGALRLVEEVLVRRRRVLGQDHPDSLASAADLAALQAGRGDTVTARNLAEEVYVRRRRVLGDLHPDTVSTAALLIMLLTALGKQDSAQELTAYMSARSTDALRESGAPAPPRTEVGPALPRSQDGSAHRPTDDHERTGELALGSLLRRRDVVAPRVTGSDATWHDHARGGSAAALLPRATGRPSDVLLSYAEGDEGWATWAASHLEEAGHTVDFQAVGARGEGTEPPAVLSRHGGVVLALISSGYLALTGLADESEGSRLRLLDALDQGRLVPILIERPEPPLPPQLARHVAGPPLSDLDEEAARELLDYAVRSPHRPVAEREFPGSSVGPSASAVLERQLVNALLNSAFIASPGERDTWLELIDTAAGRPIARSTPRSAAARMDIMGIVRTCLRHPNGLAAMVEALEALDPDSAEVREVRRIADRIELLRDAV